MSRPALDHAPGIYFDLAAEEYHADSALSASGMKRLMTGPLEFWRNSVLNPHREEVETDAKELGTAFHKRLLEGRDLFQQHYGVELDRDDFPSALSGADTLKEQCKTMGLPVSGTIAVLCARILEADPEAQLWPVLVEENAAANEGKILLSASAFARIEASAALVEAHPDARRALRDGYSEVSIFWTDDETGIRLKARLDYLRLRAVVDLKTFSNRNGKPIDRAVVEAVARERYYIQAVVYVEACEAAKTLIKADPGCVHGPVDPAFITEFANSPQHGFVFVFLESCGFPAIRVRSFDQLEPGAKKGASQNLYWLMGVSCFRYAVSLYKDCVNTFGTDRPWTDYGEIHANGTIPSFRDEDFPQWMFDDQGLSQQ